MSTLGLRIEPSVVRVNDADSATVKITLDNRRGRSGLRIVLDSHDPDGAIQFTFSPPVVDLVAGQVTAVFSGCIVAPAAGPGVDSSVHRHRQ
jgi:hypothetical protein